jgi:hypothetical protein
MKMRPDDYHVYSISDGVMMVVAHFSGMALEWPSAIENVQSRYKFQSNEAMEDWMIGNYSGHAKYQLVE